MKKFYLLLLLVAAISLTLNAQNRYVKEGGSGAKTGLSWADAADDLQATINAAGTGEKVWVAKGTYRPTQNLTGTDDVDKSFVLKSGVEIYGGFAGTEPSNHDLSTRNFVTNETILSGDLGGGINTHHVVVNNAAVSGVKLDGFTVSGGKATGTGTVTPGSIGRNNGAGIFLSASSGLVLSNLNIKDNVASNYGGGIYLTYSGTELIKLEKVNFISNTGTVRAGAIYLTRSAGTATVEINGSKFDGNGTALGGAIFNSAGQVSISNSDFENSTGTSGGVINNNTGAILNISGSNFKQNTASGVGGAIYVFGGTVTVENSLFEGNTAAGNGGAINQNAGTTTLTGVTFKTNAGNNGGGVYFYGGTLTVEDNIFEGNTSVLRGAGTYQYNGIFKLTNTSFSGNTATSDGGAVYRFGGSVLDIDKCVFKNNISGADAGAVKAIFGTTKVYNSVFYNNSAQEGGALYIGNTSGASVAAILAVNNTFYKNKDVNKAGVISFFNTTGRADIKLYNSILVDNTSTNGAAEVRMTALETPTAVQNIPIALEHNLMQSTLTSQGNLTVANNTVYNAALPLFASTIATDLNFLQLVEGQATEKGNSTFATDAGILLGTDLAGLLRLKGSLDLGAYEYQGVLPVQFDYFKATKVGNAANLTWRTLAETANSHFVIERGSSPANFSTLTQKTAVGTATTPSNYVFVDQNPLAGINYYRLIQYDTNGDSKVLGEQALNFSLSATQNLVYPNPARQEVFVKLADVSGSTTIDLISLTGQKLLSKTYSISPNGEITIDLTHVPTGTYVLWLNKGKTNSDKKKILVVK